MSVGGSNVVPLEDHISITQSYNTMKISTGMTVGQLKTSFHTQYPGLKLECYETPHETFAASSNQDLLDDLVVISNTADIEFELKETMTVAEVESLFKSHFDLNVQVFRKSKDLWLQTSATDDWTLEKQNGKGLRSML